MVVGYLVYLVDLCVVQLGYEILDYHAVSRDVYGRAGKLNDVEGTGKGFGGV